MIPELETQKLINDNLRNAEKLCDEALALVCESAALAIREKAFIYTRHIIDCAEMVERSKCNCFMRIVAIDSKTKTEPAV